VEHKGIEVELTLWGPDEKELATGGPVSRQGVEVLSFITSVAGGYHLRVSAPRDSSAAGRYELSVQEQHTVCAADSSRVEAQKRLSAGLLDRKRGDFRQAVLQFEKALSLWRKADDSEGEIDTAIELGWTEISLDPNAARERLESALATARRAGYLRGQAKAWDCLGFAHSSLSQTAAAQKAYWQAIELWKDLGDTAEQGLSLYNLGYLLFDSLYDLDRAGQSFDQALQLARRAGDQGVEAYARTGLCLVAEHQGDLDGALRCYESELDLSRKTHDRLLESTLLSNEAGIHSRRGQLQEALRLYDEALADGGPGDRSQEEQTLHNLATVYVALGEPGKALTTYQRVLELQQGAPKSAFTLNSIGSVFLTLKDNAKAGEYFERALKLSRETQNPGAEALSLHNRGRLRIALGKAEDALKDLNDALALRRDRLGDLAGQASTLLEIGNVQSQLKQPEQAAASYGMALKLARKIEARPLISRSLQNQAKLDRDRGDLGNARREIENALTVVEKVRSDVGGDDQRTSFFAANRYYYEFFVDLLMRMRLTEQALEASELARARGLSDLLAEGSIDVRSGVDPDLKRQETALANRFTWTEVRLKRVRQEAATNEAAAKQLEDSLQDLDRQQQKLVAEIRFRNPRYAEVHYPKPLAAREIEALLGEETALLEYAVGPEASYLFVVTHEGIAAHTLPGAAVLGEQVERLRRTLKTSNPALRADYMHPAADLYRELVAPAAGSLARKRNLLVSPDGVLHLLPFEALLTESPPRGQPYSRMPFLLRTHSISYVPSASVLAGLHRPRSVAAAAKRGTSKAFLAFANPFYEPPEDGGPALLPLRESEPEVRAIAGLYPGNFQLYLGRDATKDNVIGNRLLERTSRLHFAVHGVANEQRPQLSGLALARGRDKNDDGFLRVHDIFDLKLNADLVVLSACDTGGAQVNGEGLVGLTRAFSYAGASSLVVSLWRAPEDSAPDLMANFYRRLATGKGEALRTAKLKMIEEGRYAHPFYWAPFVLVGDPR